MVALIALVGVWPTPIRARLLPPIRLPSVPRAVFASGAQPGFVVDTHDKLYWLSPEGARLGTANRSQGARVRGIDDRGRAVVTEDGTTWSQSPASRGKIGPAPEARRVIAQGNVLIVEREASSSVHVAVYCDGREVATARRGGPGDALVYHAKRRALYALHVPRGQERLTLRRYRGTGGVPDLELSLISPGGFYVPAGAYLEFPGAALLDEGRILCMLNAVSFTPEAVRGLRCLDVSEPGPTTAPEIPGQGPRLVAVTIALDTGRVEPFLLVQMPLLEHAYAGPDHFAYDARSRVLGFLGGGTGSCTALASLWLRDGIPDAMSA